MAMRKALTLKTTMRMKTMKRRLRILLLLSPRKNRPSIHICR
jgi:hypothetical protein